MSSLSEETGGRTVAVDTAAFGAAADATVVGPNVHFDGRITRVSFVPSAAITANGTNFSTLTLQNKGGLKTGTTAVATRSWAATNSVAATKEDFTLSGTPANLEVKAGDRLDLVQTHGGTGLAIPTGTLIITYLPRF